MSRGIRKGIVNNNPKLRKILCSVNGTGATPVASGLDASQITEVIDTGVGIWTVILKYPFNPAALAKDPHVMVNSLTPTVNCVVAAVDHDRVTINAFDTATGAVATDADFNLEITGNDGRIAY